MNLAGTKSAAMRSDVDAAFREPFWIRLWLAFSITNAAFLIAVMIYIYTLGKPLANVLVFSTFLLASIVQIFKAARKLRRSRAAGRDRANNAFTRYSGNDPNTNASQ